MWIFPLDKRYLNKVDFDAVWETEIKPPITSGDPSQTATLDIAFVLDYSESMDWNDPNRYCKELAKEFISKLRDGVDRASVTKFSTYAYLLSELTYDKELLYQAVDEIVYDGWSTDGSAGLKTGLDSLQASMSNYKYVIFITDGEDNEYSYSYSDLINEAISMGVKIYTIGMGSATEYILRQLADETGGKYYHATTGTTSEDIIDLEDVFKDISSETVDLTVDSNNDGIPDYYNDLILEGDLVLSNGSYQFIGYDFNYDENGMPSDDYDGDGLKNGEELIVVQNGDKVYLKLYSNPILPDSDSDRRSDAMEKITNSDPLKYSYDHASLWALSNDDRYMGYQLANKYDTDIIFAIAVATTDVLGVKMNYSDLCKEAYLDYFYDYAIPKIEANESIANGITFLENVHDALGKVNKAIKAIKKGTDKGGETLQNIYILRNQLTSIQKRMEVSAKLENQSERLVKLADDYYEVSKKLEKYNILNRVSPKVVDAGNKYKHFLNKKNKTGLSNSTTISLAMTAFSSGLDIIDTIDTYSKLKANSAAYLESMELLSYMSKNDGRLIVRSVTQDILNLLNSDFNLYYQQLEEAIKNDIKNGTIKFAVSMLAKEMPYINAISTTFDIFNLLIGISHKADCVNLALYYESLTSAARTLALSTVSEKTNALGGHTSYDCIYDNIEETQRYLTHLAQLRLVSENNAIEYFHNKGLITWFFNNGYKEAQAWNEEVKKDVFYYASVLNLSISEVVEGSSGGGTGGGGGGSW